MNLQFSDEVREAIRKRRPLVALETSVVAQGLPYPRNVESANACEKVIRDAGAVPAATAVIDGEICVGLSAGQLERLADGKDLLKLGSRDLAIAVAQKRTGGTTVSATCEIAAASGIKLFATGGIGGIHRNVAADWDVSQDLWALSRFAVAVVCAGAKSVLDLPKTLEALESLGVPVIGVRTSEFPSFYSVSSGLPLEHRVEDAAGAAELVRARTSWLNQGGLILALPPPAEHSMPREEVEQHVEAALAEASRQKISGKAVTPFLLKELSARTAGRSLSANLDLLVNNARFAAEVAAAIMSGDAPKDGFGFRA